MEPQAGTPPSFTTVFLSLQEEEAAVRLKPMGTINGWYNLLQDFLLHYLQSVGGALVSIYEIYSEYGSVGLAVDNDYTQGGTGADGPYNGSGRGANIMNANSNVNGSSALANTGSGGGGAASTNSTNATGGSGGQVL